MKKLLLICMMPLAVLGMQAQQRYNMHILQTEDSAFFATEEARQIGNQLLLYQRTTGGWPKNIDMVKPLTDKEKEAVLAQKNRQDDSTIDNKATITQIPFLAQLYHQTKDDRYKAAFLSGMDFLLSGQYDNGGWPQFWPKNRDYQIHITYNDNAIVNVMKILRDARKNIAPYGADLVDDNLRQRCEQAFNKGIECFLRTQIIIDGEPTVWCQQHDRETLLPTKARAYELPSFATLESAAITFMLMQVSKPDERIARAIKGAMAWFEAHKLTGIRLEKYKPTAANGGEAHSSDIRIVEDAAASPLWARFYDLEEGKPFFCDRDGVPKRDLQEIGYERRNGYGWFNDSPAKLYKRYETWKQKNPAYGQKQNTVVGMLPANNAVDVNVDTHLVLTLAEDATIGKQGFVSVYDKNTGELVDRLDMSIPAGPTQGQPKNPAAQYTPTPYIYKSQHITNRNTKAGTPSGVNAWDNSRYQLDIIGAFSDGFHFYPIIAKGKQLTIYLHHNMLEYGHEYYVTIDKGVVEGLDGIKGESGWTFRTKEKAPAAELRQLTVSADGKGDFSTVQGAIDFIPDSVASDKDRYHVFVKNGDYEELVYFRNKRFVTIEGESREGVLIHYRNNEVFNPHPADIKTNEVKGTFPSRRAAFAVDNCSDLVFRNLTFKTDCKGQAEGLLVNGERNVFENVHVIGDGDALQANGSCYWLNCRIDGGGDTILGRGPSFFDHCTITSYGAFMWIRNTADNHGNVFVNCRLKGLSDFAELGRLPDNKGKNYPHAECVLLNCTLENIPAYGWGVIDESAKTANIMEYNSRDAEGNPIDVSKRNPLMRQLDKKRDSRLIRKYSDRRWVLGWK